MHTPTETTMRESTMFEPAAREAAMREARPETSSRPLFRVADLGKYYGRHLGCRS